MQDKARKWIYVVLIIVFVASVCMVIQSMISARKAEEARQLAEEMAKMETTVMAETTAPILRQRQFYLHRVRQLNKDYF